MFPFAYDSSHMLLITQGDSPLAFPLLTKWNSPDYLLPNIYPLHQANYHGNQCKPKCHQESFLQEITLNEMAQNVWVGQIHNLV